LICVEEFRVPRGAGATVTYPKTRISPEVSGRRSLFKMIREFEFSAGTARPHVTNIPRQNRWISGLKKMDTKADNEKLKRLCMVKLFATSFQVLNAEDSW